jgi:hypothetical protein
MAAVVRGRAGSLLRFLFFVISFVTAELQRSNAFSLCFRTLLRDGFLLIASAMYCTILNCDMDHTIISGAPEALGNLADTCTTSLHN